MCKSFYPSHSLLGYTLYLSLHILLFRFPYHKLVTLVVSDGGLGETGPVSAVLGAQVHDGHGAVGGGVGARVVPDQAALR